MSRTNESPSFTDFTLNMSERFQWATRTTKWAPKLIEKFTGSDSPAYEQLLWLPPKLRKDPQEGHPLVVGGDNEARRTASGWKNVAVLAVRRQMLADAEHPDRVEAIAYRSARALHVGVHVTGAEFIGAIDDEWAGIATRIGNGEAAFQIGVYNHLSRHFMGYDKNAVRIQEASIPEEALPDLYPGISEV